MKKLFLGNGEVKVDADTLDLDSRVAMIQALIPIGLEAVDDVLQRQVLELVGDRYDRKDFDQPLRRWGKQKGWVYLGDQKVPIEVPRVRDTSSDAEVPLKAYKALQSPRKLDEGMLIRVLKGISCRN